MKSLPVGQKGETRTSIMLGNETGRYAGQRGWRIRKATELANTPASMLCAGDAENKKQPGFYVEPDKVQYCIAAL